MDKLEIEEAKELLLGQAMIAQSANWWFPFDRAVVLTDRPKSIILRDDNRLHRDNGPVIQWRDGYGIYALNGVLMPAWVIETPEGELDPKRLMDFTNADQRSQFALRVGYERILHAHDHQFIDELNDMYKLVLIRLKDGRHRPFLYMQNPTCPELWHVEGVPPNVTTVKEALAFRNDSDEEPLILT